MNRVEDVQFFDGVHRFYSLFPKKPNGNQALL
jgi:hypothetical protein